MSESSYRRTDLATEQLQVAIELFLSGRRYVSALTLAGAAEEILGKAPVQRGLTTVLDHEYRITGLVEEALRGQPYKRKEFVSRKNRVRNAPKHMPSDIESTVTADLEDESLWMIVRACDNYQRLDLPPSAFLDNFENWFWTYVVGEDYQSCE